MHKEQFKTAMTGLAGVFFMLAIFFLPAGRLDWWPAWVFVTLYLVFVIALTIWAARHDPALLRERRRPGEGVKRWDRALMQVYTVVLVGMLVVAGLDAGRFNWAPAPFWLQVIGWVALVLAGGLVTWTFRVNTFLSPSVRIQTERDQQVVSTGPYAIVRHPMYLGIATLMPALALALGSLWALLPAGVIVALFVMRTALEDRTLHEELPGYQNYAQQVRYRLVPGVW